MESVKQMIQGVWEAAKEMAIAIWVAVMEMATTSLEYLASFLHQDPVTEDGDSEMSNQEDAPGLYTEQTPDKQE